MTFPATHIGVSINRSPADVYAYVSNPENLPQWAEGLGGNIENVDGEWIADSPMGRIKIEFAPQNSLGVLDHDVTLPSGETFYNPMRVFANGEGSEVVFTLYRRPEMDDKAFEADRRAVMKDLETLKSLLEKGQ